MAVSTSDFPYTGPYSVEGNGKHKGNTAIALKRAMSRLGFLPWEPDKWDNLFNKKLEEALDEWNPGKNGYAEGRYDKIRGAKVTSGSHKGEYALDSECRRLVKEEAKSQEGWSNLGPCFNGGKSVLQHDLTHATSGISLYPAFDDAFSQGTTIIAPEEITVTKASSSNPGDACLLLESRRRLLRGGEVGPSILVRPPRRRAVSRQEDRQGLHDREGL
jgi:hypothetical protein